MANRSLIAGVILVAAIIVVNIPIFDVQEAYTELEPYQETYSDTESYTRDCNYRVIDATLTSHMSISIGVYHTLIVLVQNTDDYGGQFSVELKLYDVDGLFARRTVRDHIGAGLSTSFSADFNTELGQDVRGEYSVDPPSITDQRSVTKTRTSYRQVTKYRTVKKSLITIILQST